MDKSHTIEVAATIWQQLKQYTDYNILWSWGIRNIRAAEIDSRAGLAFDVNGFLFKGTVVVVLDEGADLYDICLLQKNTVTIVSQGIYFDDLGSEIDSIVERSPGMTDAEYNQMVNSAYSDN